MTTCPSCGARPGERCITRGGNILGINQQHAERYRVTAEAGDWTERYDREWRELASSERFTLGKVERRAE